MPAAPMICPVLIASPGFDVEPAHVQERTGQTESVIDQHRAAGQHEIGLREGHDAGRGSMDRCAFRHGHVQSMWGAFGVPLSMR